jgi:DNA-binding CsgD family transcriptional regulator
VTLVDRLTETDVMQGLLDEVRAGSSGVLVLRGRVGMGKTVLLREVAERAAKDGMRVARAAGIAAETEFDFAGLHQLLLPFAGGLGDLPDPQRAALGTVFGLAAGQASVRPLVDLAALTLLTGAAEKQPVLCIVDDAQWLDRVSLEVLAFVARRLLANRVGVVFGLRGGAERPAALSGFPELSVGPPPAEAVRTLVGAALEMGTPDSRRAHDTMLGAFSAAQLDGFAAIHAGLLFDHSAWADLERHAVPALRDRGAVTALIPVLFSLGCYHLRAGQLGAAETALAEGRALAEGAGHREWLAGFNSGEVLLLALRGNVSEGRALAARLLGEPIKQHWRDVTHQFVAVLELEAGHYDAALRAALEARALWPLLSPEDAVEAAVRCGRPEIARAALDDFAPLAAAGGTPWALGVLARCRALLAGDDPGADEDYQQSIGYLQDTPVVLALARSRLLYGEWLRRQRRHRDARAQLRSALEAFERTGARGFAGRTRAELAAAGEHDMARTSKDGPRLTPQEAQVARLAAAGAINRDIATQLFLSPATVDYHLRKVYRKLDVTRRTGLPRALLDAGLDG